MKESYNYDSEDAIAIMQAAQVGEKLAPEDEVKKLIFEVLDEVTDPNDPENIDAGYREIVKRGDFFTPGVFGNLSVYEYYKELADTDGLKKKLAAVEVEFDSVEHEKQKKIFSLLEQIRMGQ